MNILLTGASGFVGTRLVKLLDTPDNNIRIISRKVHPKFETIVCDFEYNSIPALSMDSIDIVFHLAGLTHDNRDDFKVQNIYQKINVDATVELAKLAVNNLVKNFVFVSSVKAGSSLFNKKCIDEKDDVKPEGVYGKTKLEAELKLLKIADKSNMCLSIIRPSLIYGPNVKGNLKLMISGIERGWFPPIPETGNRRSMIHVDDLVRAVVLVAGNEHAQGKFFIATDGNTYSSCEIYEAICHVLGKSKPKWHLPKLLFDMAAIISPRMKYKINKLLKDECYSSERLQSLGFKPQFSLRNMNETSF